MLTSPPFWPLCSLHYQSECFSHSQPIVCVECAHWFDKPAFMRPLVEGQDPLPGLHANTHMAQVGLLAWHRPHMRCQVD